VPESGNWHGGTLTRWMAALSAAPLSLVFPEFMKGRAVNICAKAGIGRKVRHKKHVSCKFSKKMSRSRKFLIVQGNFD